MTNVYKYLIEFLQILLALTTLISNKQFFQEFPLFPEINFVLLISRVQNQ